MYFDVKTQVQFIFDVYLLKTNMDFEYIVKICTASITRMFCVGADVINHNIYYWFMITICHMSMHV